MANLLKKALTKFFKNPREAKSLLIAMVRGSYYILKYRLFSKNIIIKFPFFCNAPVRILGPGKVTIGNFCKARLNAYKGLTIVTSSSDAKVVIGDNCSLGGLTIRCSHYISLGNNVMTAYSLIQDSFYTNKTSETSNDILNPNMISVGDNVWIGGQCIILNGTRIGNDSVLSFGCCCCKVEIGDYMLVLGSPSKRPLPINNILQIKGAAV